MLKKENKKYEEKISNKKHQQVSPTMTKHFPLLLSFPFSQIRFFNAWIVPLLPSIQICPFSPPICFFSNSPIFKFPPFPNLSVRICFYLATSTTSIDHDGNYFPFVEKQIFNVRGKGLGHCWRDLLVLPVGNLLNY